MVILVTSCHLHVLIVHVAIYSSFFGCKPYDIIFHYNQSGLVRNLHFRVPAKI